ncbi:hypothetical protein Zm00014a_038153 [Zea mays]|uniref:Uncharacterized protein n=2 Tax=Zea mays TaxID=4577 RepID=A0A3L6FYW4_MAIZE|nr:hypothetical protein Zm00014a_038153 [Zea mays]
MSIKAIGVAIKLTLDGVNQAAYPYTWLFLNCLWGFSNKLPEQGMDILFSPCCFTRGCVLLIAPTSCSLVLLSIGYLFFLIFQNSYLSDVAEAFRLRRYKKQWDPYQSYYIYHVN